MMYKLFVCVTLKLYIVFQIQANVKVLTAERDKLSTMYDEVKKIITLCHCKIT